MSEQQDIFESAAELLKLAQRQSRALTLAAEGFDAIEKAPAESLEITNMTRHAMRACLEVVSDA